MVRLEWIVAGLLAATALNESCPTQDGDGDGFTVADGDCDDGNPAVNPAVEEICDGIDNDCDGLVDGADPDVVGATVWFYDGDGDGYGDPASGTLQCEPGPGYVDNAQDCDDDDPDVSPDLSGACVGAGTIVLAPDGEDGSGSGFDSIQAALDAASDGATIYLEPGEYWVNLRFPRKRVTIEGTYPGYVTLNGENCTQGEDVCSVILFSWQSAGGPFGKGAPGAALKNLVLSGGTGTRGSEIGATSSYTYGGGIALADADPVLEQIEIRGGHATRGGGVFVLHDAPSFVDVTCADNSAESGGGFYVSFAEPTFTSCRAELNRAQTGGGFLIDNSDPMLSDVEVVDNSAQYGGGLNLSVSSPYMERLYVTGNDALEIGGGFYIYDSESILQSSTIVENTAKSGAGLNLSYANLLIQDTQIEANVSVEYGGGIYMYESNPIIARVTVEGNSAEHGGGLYLSYANIRMSNSVVSDNLCEGLGGGFYVSSSRPQLTNVIIRTNESAARGGGFYESYSVPEFVNVTFEANAAGTDGGGLFVHFNSQPVLQNTIFAFNTAVEDGDNFYLHESSSAELAYNCFYAAEAGDAGLYGVSGDQTNIVADPLFVDDPADGDITDDDVHLASDSPAIDAGQPGITWEDPDGTRNDMGAYGGPGAARWQ